MIDLLRDNALLLLFAVTAIGYLVGRISFGGIRLGSAAVLFVGLVFGALDSSLAIPLFVTQLGLVIFVYAIGLANGANFFRTLRKQGNSQILFVIGFLSLSAVLAVAFFFLFGRDGAAAAGLYAGSVTNTAGLAGVLDVINAGFSAENARTISSSVVVAFSFAYPVGVLGRILVITLMKNVWRIDYAAEAHAARHDYPLDQEIVNRAIRITNENLVGIPMRDLQRDLGWDVLFGRLVRNGNISLINGDTNFQLNDVIAIAGEVEHVDKVMDDLGLDAGSEIFTDQSIYTKRRLFVSNPDVVGQQIATLDLKDRFGALVTRVRRGDTDVLAERDTVLEMGDRVRVLAKRGAMTDLVALFGDSYQAVSRVNLLSLGFGVTFGILLGMIRITLPGDVDFQLGSVGGTLIVALILGNIQRTGTVVWTLPYSANQTLQQVGLVLLLAGIGVASGNSLETTLATDWILTLLGAATVIVVVTTLMALVIGYKVMKLPFALVAGMVASQPAVMSYLAESAENQLPEIGFSFSMPIGLIAKVTYAQLIFSILHNFSS